MRTASKTGLPEILSAGGDSASTQALCLIAIGLQALENSGTRPGAAQLKILRQFEDRLYAIVSK